MLRAMNDTVGLSRLLLFPVPAWLDGDRTRGPTVRGMRPDGWRALER